MAVIALSCSIIWLKNIVIAVTFRFVVANHLIVDRVVLCEMLVIVFNVIFVIAILLLGPGV